MVHSHRRLSAVTIHVTVALLWILRLEFGHHPPHSLQVRVDAFQVLSAIVAQYNSQSLFPPPLQKNTIMQGAQWVHSNSVISQ